MELDVFIKNTLTSIIKGIKESQEFAKENGAIINPSHQWDAKGGNRTTNVKVGEDTITASVSRIDFDIAVSASSEATIGAGMGINVFSVKIGGSAEDKQNNETISRLKFEINVVLPFEKSPSVKYPFVV